MGIDDQTIRLMWIFNFFQIVSILKAPIIALWTHYYQKKNHANQAQPGNELELQPLHSISSEGQQMMEIESE